MSEVITLARPYAAALYKWAQETQSTDRWSESLMFLSQIMEDGQVAKAASNPKIRKDQFEEFFLDLCRKKLPEDALNLVKLLIQNNRLRLLKDISSLYERYRAENEGYVDAEIATAYPLEESDETHLTALLEKALGKSVRMHATQDSSLIGGVLIRTGDKVIDASIRGQIERLAKRLYS